MSTPSRSRLSAMGNENYFDWRENMERHQQESERQVQALFCETRKLEKERRVAYPGMKSSPLVVKRYDLKRNFHQLAQRY
ncbi:hypothetical protein CK203_033462 [Vitis vinifera]|uniref:Uncharacterized protein n=1 Tax=Vitis vinifera TaxID=29760 RepID=A0A438FMN1_VITVI|nr:hypothetical protein CK203_033462 [Vitis vinifera]